MIKSKEQARRIQAQRAAIGKMGMAQAVKRYMKRERISAL